MTAKPPPQTLKIDKDSYPNQPEHPRILYITGDSASSQMAAEIGRAVKGQRVMVVLDSLHLSPLWPYVGAPVALTSICAIAVLWIRRRSVLDLWLMVVMFIFSIEIPLSYYPDPARFSVGWYTVRVFGLLSSGIAAPPEAFSTSARLAPPACRYPSPC